MSNVTNIIISGSFLNDEPLKTALLEITNGASPFTKINNQTVGGDKSLEGDLYIAAINCLDDDKFRSIIHGLKETMNLYDYKTMQIFIKKEHDELWTVSLASEY